MADSTHTAVGMDATGRTAQKLLPALNIGVSVAPTGGMVVFVGEAARRVEEGKLQATPAAAQYRRQAPLGGSNPVA